MATITKLGKPFRAGDEATAASQNEQNEKIDEILDTFSKEGANDTGMNRTIAIPFTKDSNTVKVTTLGTGLSVSSNTLSVDAFNYATATGAGIAKVGNGLEMIASTSGSSTQDKLQVKAGDGIAVTSAGGVAVKVDNTLEFDSNGKLKVKNPSEGKTYTAATPITISSADKISLNYSSPLVQDSSNKLTVQDATTDKKGVVQVGTGIKVSSGTISFDSTNYVMLAIGSKIYYSLNDGTKVEIANNGTISVVSDDNNHYSKVNIFVPINKTLSVRDSTTINVTNEFVESGLVIISGALYTKYSKISGNYLIFQPGSYLSQQYTVTIS